MKQVCFLMVGLGMWASSWATHLPNTAVLHIAYQHNGQRLQAEARPTAVGAGPALVASGFRLWFEQDAFGPALEFRIRLEPTFADNEPFRLDTLYVDFPQTFTRITEALANGFQSWSHSQVVDPRTPYQMPRGPLRRATLPYGDYHLAFRAQLPNHWASHSHGYVRDDQDSVLFIGSLADTNTYTTLVYIPSDSRIRVYADCEGMKPTAALTLAHWVVVAGTDATVERYYWQALRQQHDPQAPQRTGWTSWYYHYTRIDENLIQARAESFRSLGLPIDVIQIDDGYQRAVGDWLTPNRRFAGGMHLTAKRIRENGFTPGIWLAPFVVEQGSSVYKQHKKDWLLRLPTGKKAVAGNNPLWGGVFRPRFYALDVTHPDVRAYVGTVLDSASQAWGYQLLKLDFLYAAALVPRNGLSKAQMMYLALKTLNAHKGQSALLGCGVPLAPAYGLVEYCRIGPDVSLNWQGMRVLAWARNRERISTENTLDNTILRTPLNQRVFRNDPDVFMLRKKKNRLTTEQALTIYLINQALGGLVFTSDNPAEYTAEVLALYRLQFPQLPSRVLRMQERGGVVEASIGIGGLKYRLVANLGDRTAQYNLGRGVFYESLSDSLFRSENGLWLLPPFGSRLFLEVDTSARVAIAGSPNHLFPGAELVETQFVPDNIRLVAHPQAQQLGTVWLTCPTDRNTLRVNGQDIPATYRNGVKVVAVAVGTTSP